MRNHMCAGLQQAQAWALKCVVKLGGTLDDPTKRVAQCRAALDAGHLHQHVALGHVGGGLLNRLRQLGAQR
jgi:hypothetical protein